MRAVGASSERGVDRATRAARVRADMRRARALARALEWVRPTPRRRDARARGIADDERARAGARAFVVARDAADVDDARVIVVRGRRRRRRRRARRRRDDGTANEMILNGATRFERRRANDARRD